GKKHLRKIVLEQWQKNLIMQYPREFLSGLYESDGSRYTNIVSGKYEYIDFTNKSNDIHHLYEWASSLIGVETKKIFHWITSRTKESKRSSNLSRIHVTEDLNQMPKGL